MQKNPLSFDILVSNLGEDFKQIKDHRKSNSTINGCLTILQCKHQGI